VSRVILLSMSEGDVVARCKEGKVGVSTIECLASGGVRLVCMSSDGAEAMRRMLKAHIISGTAVRERVRPSRPLW
jgi:hypothetical protein